MRKSSLHAKKQRFSNTGDLVAGVSVEEDRRQKATAGPTYTGTKVPIPIETARLILRPWRDSDREPFARMTADPRVMEFYPSLLTREQSDAFIDRVQANLQRDGFTFLAAEIRETGELIGFTGLSIATFPAPFTPCVEVGWRLAAEHWGAGYATEAGRAALRFGFDELQLKEIVAFVAVPNIRSRRVAEKLGMTRDPADDFEYPLIAEGHPLRPHVLYRARP